VLELDIARYLLTDPRKGKKNNSISLLGQLTMARTESKPPQSPVLHDQLPFPWNEQPVPARIWRHLSSGSSCMPPPTGWESGWPHDVQASVDDYECSGLVGGGK
jgi:hypothetical protein